MGKKSPAIFWKEKCFKKPVYNYDCIAAYDDNEYSDDDYGDYSEDDYGEQADDGYRADVPQPLSDDYDYSVADSYSVRKPDQMNEMIDLRSSNNLVEDNTRRRSIPRNSYGDRINRL